MSNPKKELHWFERLPKEEKPERRKTDTNTRHNKRGDLTMENRVNVNLEKYLVETGQWIDEVATHLDHTERKDWAFNALRSVLHVIRDRTITEEAFQLSAQLPMLLRGLFFEGYQLSNKPEKFHLDEMLNRIEEGMGPASDFTPEQVFKAVLLVLNDHISKGELNDIYASMPKDIKSIWDESLKKHTV